MRGIRWRDHPKPDRSNGAVAAYDAGSAWAPVLEHAVYRIKLEFAQFGPLNSCVKRTDDSAPHFELGRFALAENAHANEGPFGHKRKRVTRLPSSIA